MNDDTLTFDTPITPKAEAAPLPAATKDSVKAHIADAKTYREERVQLTRLGLTALVREMNGTDHDAYNQSLRKREGFDEDTKQPVYGQDWTNARAKLVARCWIDDATNARMWTDAEVAEVGKLPTSELNKLFEASLRVNNMTPDEVEELVKNSVATDGDGS